MKVNQEVQAIFNAAYNEAKIRSHEYLTPEHILYAALSFEQIRTILEACDADVETRTIDWLADELRALGLLGANEWLVAVPLGGKANQGLVIRSRANNRLGWIRIGGGAPGSVRRISYSAPERQIGPRCWLLTDWTWQCVE